MEDGRSEMGIEYKGAGGRGPCFAPSPDKTRGRSYAGFVRSTKIKIKENCAGEFEVGRDP